MNAVPKKFLLLYLELTRSCSMRCKMCDIWRIKSNPKKELSTERLLKLADESTEMGVKVITLFGGEPLFRKDLSKIIKKMSENDIITSLNTNCFLLTEKRAKELYDSGLNHVSISLDGSQPEIHDYLRGVDGVFDKVVRGIKILRKYPISLSILTVITKHNYKDLANIVKLANELGVNSVRFAPMHISYPYNIRGSQLTSLAKFNNKELIDLRDEILRVKDLLRECGMTSDSDIYFENIPKFFLKKLEQICFAGYAYCYIDCYGNVSPCIKIPSTCDITNTTLKQIWHSEEFNKLRQRVRKLQCPGCWDISYTEPNFICQPLYLLRHASETFKMVKHFGFK